MRHKYHPVPEIASSAGEVPPRLTCRAGRLHDLLQRSGGTHAKRWNRTVERALATPIERDPAQIAMPAHAMEFTGPQAAMLEQVVIIDDHDSDLIYGRIIIERAKVASGVTTVEYARGALRHLETANARSRLRVRAITS